MLCVLQDLVAEFNSGRYQYGLAGVETSKGVKYVLLIWQGEGTPILRKSACAHHAAEVRQTITNSLDPTSLPCRCASL